MLHLNKLSLTQFKNYSAASFEFKERVTGICGLNGMGKTNLLDAIYYLCFTKSYFSKSDLLNVEFNADGFRIDGILTQTIAKNNYKEDFNVVSIFRGTGKKEILVNDIAYEKFSSHIGKFPCVMIAPDDIEIITGGSEQRRKFIDTVLSQMDANYLQQLIIYNKVLLQRNSLLKSFAEQKKRNMQLLQVLDSQLIQPGNEIYKKRKSFLEQLIPLAKKFYLQIADNNELIDLFYESQLNENTFDEVLKTSLDKDLIMQRSYAGIHKDDLGSQLNGKSFKNVASQGQKKSLLFALKLAEFEMLKENKSFAPLLLLDDVFEKLDDLRMQNLLQWVCVNNESQVFITDTHLERLKNSLDNFGFKSQIIELK
ncbi:MAG: DNA replication and repair protein RecF [Bacteroidota bacterium]|nr:DNA replication and repair protein RecF [Bacteroidota bacterium]